MSKPIHINATQENYSKILPAIAKAVDAGGKLIIICDEIQERKATSDERKLSQNALMWTWNNYLNRTSGEKVKAIHGGNKLNMLLPMYKTWGDKRRRRAEFIESILNLIPSYEVKTAVAYDMVRTSDLGIKQMAEYLSEYQRSYAEDEIILESNSDLEFKSLMVYADEGRV